VIGGFTIRYASFRNSSRVSERFRGECLRRALCFLRSSLRRDVRSDILCYRIEVRVNESFLKIFQ